MTKSETGKRMKVQYASISMAGDRSYNEDAVLTIETEGQYMFGVADGLGGHGFGEVASKTVCEAVESCFLQPEKRLAPDFLEETFRSAQQELCDTKQKNAYGDMMTTMVLLSIGSAIQWAHVGDSRLYYFENGTLVTHTLDHSVPQILVYAGEITEDEIRHHPDRNRLLKAMGRPWEKDEFTLSEPISVKEKQAFLLCSDGFWEHIVEAKMQQLLNEADSVEQWLSEMVAHVKMQGHGQNMDNYSAVVVWVTQEKAEQ